MEIHKWSIFCYNTWSFVLMKRVSSVIHNKPFSIIPLFMLLRKPPGANQGNFESHPSLSTLFHTSPSSTSSEGKGAGN